MSEPPEATPRTVTDALLEVLPDASPVTSAEHIPRGWGNENWVLDTELGRLTVKLGRSSASVGKWRSAGKVRELAADAGVPVPEQLAYAERSEPVGGRIVRVFRYIDGLHPSSVINDAARRNRFFGQLGKAVARLHAVEIEQFGSRIGEPGFDRWSEYMSHRWNQVRARAKSAGIEPVVVERVGVQLLALLGEIDDLVRPALVHRDLYLDNLLADADGNLLAILDFDQAEAWEPLADFLKLDWWVFGHYPGSASAFEHTYFHGSPPFQGQDVRRRVLDLIENLNLLANLAPGNEQGPFAEDRLQRALDA